MTFSFNFQKDRWDYFAFYFDSHCPSTEDYSSLSLSSAVALFISLALTVAKFSTPFGRVKGQPQAWWSAERQEAVSERRKILLPLIEVTKIVRLTSLLPDMPRLSSPRSRLKHGRRHAFLSLSLLNLCILSFVLSLTPLSPPPTSSTIPLPGSRLWSTLTT